MTMNALNSADPQAPAGRSWKRSSKKAELTAGIHLHWLSRISSAQVTWDWKQADTSPDLWRLMDRRLGNNLASESSGSSIAFRWLLARTRVSSEGNIAPNFRISVQSWRLLSVICRSFKEWQQIEGQDTVSYSLRHRKSSSKLERKREIFHCIEQLNSYLAPIFINWRNK